MAEAQPEPVAQIVTSDPYFTFAQAVILLHGHRQHPAPGISPRSSIDPTAQLGEGIHRPRNRGRRRLHLVSRGGDMVAVGAKSEVNRNLGSGQRVFGYPAFAQREAAAAYAAFKFLPEFRRRLQEMEERLARFESGTRDRKPEEDAPSA